MTPERPRRRPTPRASRRRLRGAASAGDSAWTPFSRRCDDEVATRKTDRAGHRCGAIRNVKARGYASDQAIRSNGHSEHSSAASHHGEGALSEQGSVTTAEAGPDEPSVAPSGEPPLPPEEPPLPAQLKAWARRPCAQHLHPPAVQLDVVVGRPRDAAPTKDGRRCDASARPRRKERRGRPRPARSCTNRPAVHSSTGIDIPRGV